MDPSTKILRTMRAQSWFKIRGELTSILATFWDDKDGTDEQFKMLNTAITDFIKYVEDNGLQQ